MGALAEIVGKVSLDGSGVATGAKRIEGVVGRMGATIKAHIGSAFAGVVGIYALERLAEKTIKYGASIGDMAQKAGVGTEAIQKLGFAATQAGSSLEAMIGFLQKVSISRLKALGGDKESLAAFATLGVSAEDLRRKRTEDLVQQFGETMQGGDPQRFAAALRDIGGRGANALAGAFVSGLKEKFDEAEAAGLVMADPIVKQLKEVDDQFKKLSITMMIKMAPAVVWLNNAFAATLDTIGSAAAWWGGATSNIKGKNIAGHAAISGTIGATLGAFGGMPILGGVAGAGIGSLFEIFQSMDSAKGHEAYAAFMAEAAKRKHFELPGAFAPDDFGAAPAAAKEHRERIRSDALARIGGFVGGGGAETIGVQIARQQLVELKQMNQVQKDLFLHLKQHYFTNEQIMRHIF